jgi:hypothetical protein
MASASDDFNRADTSGDLGANWTDIDGTGGQIATNTARGSGVGYTTSRYSAVTFAADHSSQITKIGAGNYVGPAVRMAAGPNWYVWFNFGSLQRSSGGTVTDIASPPSFTDTDVVKLNIVGSTLEFFKNTVSQGTHGDATHATGSPGVGFFESNGFADDWAGADIGAAPSTGVIVFNMQIG